MAAVRHLGFINKFLTSLHFTDRFCISMPNFMLNGHTVAEILQFLCVILVKSKKKWMNAFNRA